MVKRSKLYIFAYIFLGFLCLLCIVPFLLVISASFSDNDWILTHGYSFIPEKPSIKAYEFLWRQRGTLMRSYWISIVITLIGTMSGLTICTLLAYPLSRPDMKGRNRVMFFVFFTMLFNGGMVSSYILYTRYLGLKNTLGGLIIPYLLVNPFNVILLRTFFQTNIPLSVIESAEIDGSGEFRLLLQIVVPMATPILATVGLLIGISYWNDWYNGMLFATKIEYYSIQCLLDKLMKDIKYLASNNFSATSSEAAGMRFSMPQATVRMAIAVLIIVPMFVMFPFFQKYFSRGITVGAVKG